MTRRVLAALAAVAVLLVGCDSSGGNDTDSTTGWSSGTVRLPDGRDVICVKYYSEALSCDWATAKVTLR